MRAFLLALHIALAAALIAAPGIAQAKSKSNAPRTVVVVTKKYQGTRGYGFLPGYEPPEITRRERYGRAPWVRDSTYPWYGYPGFYRGRWNGGGFGPCYTKTPIGPVWNCG
jgi:hypothetical protein